MQKNSLENNIFNSSDYSLIIRGIDIDLEELKSKLGFNENIKLIKQGEFISKVVGKSKKDVYIYSECNDNEDEELKLLYSFLEHLISKKATIKEYAQKHEVVIRIFIQSSLAQMYYSINNKVLHKLHELDLPVELSILSWGEVIDT